MVTIYDIAKKCNCSPATVSKVFNGYGNISDERKKMIFETAKHLGYYPNTMARSLVTKRSNTLGVVLFVNDNRAFTHELFSEILNSFRIKAEEEDYDITFISQKRKSHLGYLEHCKARSMDGVFCVSCDYDDQDVQELIGGPIPVVCFDYYGTNALSISTDNAKSLETIVDSLVALNHRKIMYITGKDVDVTRQRIEGFKRGLKRNNIPFEDAMLQQSDFFSAASAPEVTRRALESGYPFTALIYPDDYTAIAGVKELKKYGLSVPKDVSIVGFDGVQAAQIMRPGITTIAQNTAEIGALAAVRLIDMIKTGKKDNSHYLVDFEFLKGESTAQAKK